MRGLFTQIVIILSFLPLTGVFALEREKSVENCAGEVVSVHGTVLVRQEADKNKAPLALQPGNNVYPGDVINTASDGAVKILLKDKTIVDLGGSALFKVAQFKPNTGSDRQVELDMMFGKMRVAVPKKLTGEGKFQIKTRAATMGVRGTEFVVDTQSNSAGTARKDRAAPKTDVTVLQGKVDVAKAGASLAAAANPVHLMAGSQLSTSVGAAANVPVKLNETQLSGVSKSSRVVDNTFQKAVTIERAPVNNTSSGSSGRSPASNNSGSGALAGSLMGTMVKITEDVPPPVPMPPPLPPQPAPISNQMNHSYHVTVVVK